MAKATASLASILTCVALAACGGSQSPAETPSDAHPPAEPSGDGVGTAEPAPARAEVTAEACEANGGTVVGDIGDGAIHRPDYRCPSGAAPTGSIRSPEGGPVAIEGSVCCPQ